MSEAQNFAVEFKPSLKMRFWRALGFRYGAYAGRPEGDEARYTIHHTVTKWDWKDRLRILVSGFTETELCVETETLQTIKGVRTQVVVLAPGARAPETLLPDRPAGPLTTKQHKPEEC